MASKLSREAPFVVFVYTETLARMLSRYWWDTGRNVEMEIGKTATGKEFYELAVSWTRRYVEPFGVDRTMRKVAGAE